MILATLEPAEIAAIFSAIAAIAAFFSACAAVVMVWINWHNRTQSLRPELLVMGWSRNAANNPPGSGFEVIRFSKIQNVGPGIAYDISFQCDMQEEKRIAAMGMKHIPILVPSEPQAMQGDISVWWRNMKPVAAALGKFILIKLDIFSVAADGRRYRTKYVFSAMENTSLAISGSSQKVAPGLHLIYRRTLSVGTWWETVCVQAQRLWNRIERRRDCCRNRAKGSK